jgi:hypothetical protein
MPTTLLSHGTRPELGRVFYWFGDVGQRDLVLITEWGFMDENPSTTLPYLNGNRDQHGQPLLEHLDARGIGWVACWYDDQWEPRMFARAGKAPTHYGEFVLQALRRLGAPQSGSRSATNGVTR